MKQSNGVAVRGADLGFRKHHARCSQSELDALERGFVKTACYALRLNGAHPDAQNGTELLPKYRKLLKKA